VGNSGIRREPKEKLERRTQASLRTRKFGFKDLITKRKSARQIREKKTIQKERESHLSSNSIKGSLAKKETVWEKRL